MRGDWLPAGKTLPADVWARRHRWLAGVAWAHVPALAAFGLARGFEPLHVGLDVLPIALFAALGTFTRASRRLRAVMVVLALLTSSAMLVHMWDGRIEAHFHFFVMVALTALYEEWIAYGLALAYVVVHHGAAGALDPGSVYDHDSGARQPWLWAAVHGLFISGLAVANVVSWRLNEEARAGAVAAGARFRSAFDDAPTGMALVGLDGRIQKANAELGRATGYPPAELGGVLLDDLTPPAERDGGRWPRAEVADREHERRYLRRDGTTGWAVWQHSLVHDADGEPAYWISHCLDISQRKQAESELHTLAHHDPLTALPNRKRFLAHLAAALDPATRRPGRVAAVFVDLDNFKLINDSLGHAAGDRLLAAVAERLRATLRPGDVVARFGGDEFAVLLVGLPDVEGAMRVADRVGSALRAPIVLDGHQRFVTASLGLCLEPEGGARPEELLRDADAAMYRAKELGKARCEVFHDGLRERAVERLELESGLRVALERDELRLLYQPQIDLTTGRIVGVEALVRWEHPTLGLVSPAAFIPIAEQSGLIVAVGAWVVREACRQATAWPETDLEVSVNVSPRQLAAEDFCAVVADALSDSGLDPGRLCLEITETAVVADPAAAAEALERLKALGVRLALDDFGVGQSSLGQLSAVLPLDVLKIDKSFVDAMAGSGREQAIIGAVVRLGHALGLTTVAEGIEDGEQADGLRDLGCSAGQGFHFARPQTPAAIARLLQVETLGELTA